MAVKHRESYARILTQLQQEESSPQLCEAECPVPGDGPDRHERQVRLNNAEWARRRERRIEAHAARAVAHRRKCGEPQLSGEVTNGRRQQVWCVELRQEFPSLSQAARRVGRTPGNILQAIKLGTRCGGFHWQRFDEARRRAGSPVPDIVSTNVVIDGTSAGPQPANDAGRLAITLKPIRPAMPPEIQNQWGSVDLSA